MNIEERIAAAIATYNQVINVMSPNTVYMGRNELNEVVAVSNVYRPVYFMNLKIVAVRLDDYLQVARV